MVGFLDSNFIYFIISTIVGLYLFRLGIYYKSVKISITHQTVSLINEFTPADNIKLTFKDVEISGISKTSFYIFNYGVDPLRPIDVIDSNHLNSDVGSLEFSFLDNGKNQDESKPVKIMKIDPIISDFDGYGLEAIQCFDENKLKINFKLINTNSPFYFSIYHTPCNDPIISFESRFVGSRKAISFFKASDSQFSSYLAGKPFPLLKMSTFIFTFLIFMFYALIYNITPNVPSYLIPIDSLKTECINLISNPSDTIYVLKLHTLLNFKYTTNNEYGYMYRFIVDIAHFLKSPTVLVLFVLVSLWITFALNRVAFTRNHIIQKLKTLQTI